jgi:hypothetical protein
MWQAVLAFWGAIVGGVIAGGVSLWVALLAVQRDREARQVEREQTRRDAHNAFQRDAVVALHDAASAYWELAIDAYGVYRTAVGPQRGDLRSVVLPMNTAFSRMVVARAKVFDSELRRLVTELDEQAGVVSSPNNRAAADAALPVGIRLLTDIEDRVNTLPRQLV